MEVNEHMRLSNITRRHKLKKKNSSCCSTSHSHNEVSKMKSLKIQMPLSENVE